MGNVKWLFRSTVLLAVTFAFVLFVFPVEFLSLYGLDLDAAGVQLAYILGSYLLGLALINWQVIRTRDLHMMRMILFADFLMDALTTAVALNAMVSGIGNSMLWEMIIINALLASGFAYYWLKSYSLDASIELAAITDGK